MTVLLDRFLHNAQTAIPSPHSEQKQCPQFDITWSGARSKQTQQASFDMPALIKVPGLPPGWCWAAAGIAAGAGGPVGGLAAGSLALGVGESCLRTGRVLVAGGRPGFSSNARGNCGFTTALAYGLVAGGSEPIGNLPTSATWPAFPPVLALGAVRGRNEKLATTRRHNRCFLPVPHLCSWPLTGHARTRRRR